MRKLMRSIARHNMEKAGAAQINKKDSTGKSKFSKYWRAYAFASFPKNGLNRKGAKAHA